MSDKDRKDKEEKSDEEAARAVEDNVRPITGLLAPQTSDPRLGRQLVPAEFRLKASRAGVRPTTNGPGRVPPMRHAPLSRRSASPPRLPGMSIVCEHAPGVVSSKVARK